MEVSQLRTASPSARLRSCPPLRCSHTRPLPSPRPVQAAPPGRGLPGCAAAPAAAMAMGGRQQRPRRPLAADRGAARGWRSKAKTKEKPICLLPPNANKPPPLCEETVMNRGSPDVISQAPRSRMPGLGAGAFALGQQRICQCFVEKHQPGGAPRAVLEDVQFNSTTTPAAAAADGSLPAAGASLTLAPLLSSPTHQQRPWLCNKKVP